MTNADYFNDWAESMLRAEKRLRETPPTQEADGHFRGCARLGKCDCPANAPRDDWHSDREPLTWRPK